MPADPKALMQAQMMAGAGGPPPPPGPASPGPGGPPAAAPPSAMPPVVGPGSGAPMDPQQARTILNQLGITESALPMVANAVQALMGAPGGGAMPGVPPVAGPPVGVAR